MAKDANGYGSELDGISEEQLEALETAFNVGATIRDAAGYAGVAERTLYRWFAEGETHTEDTPQRRLYERLRDARSGGRVNSLGKLRTSEDWRAHAKWLAFQDRAYSEARHAQQVEHTVTLMVEREQLQELSDEEFEAAMRAFQKLGLLPDGSEPLALVEGDAVRVEE